MANSCGVNPRTHICCLGGKSLNRDEAIAAWNIRHNAIGEARADSATLPKPRLNNYHATPK